jgi:hypothetical protein
MFDLDLRRWYLLALTLHSTVLTIVRIMMVFFQAGIVVVVVVVFSSPCLLPLSSSSPSPSFLSDDPDPSYLMRLDSTCTAPDAKTRANDRHSILFIL